MDAGTTYTIYSFIDIARGVLLALLPILLALYAGKKFWNVWKQYRAADFHGKQEHVLLEIKLPAEISKSPAAMEVLLTSMHQMGGEFTWIDRHIKGSVRPSFSLELISIEGKIKFFIWMRKGLRKLVESYIYAQYPDVEIHESPDYTSSVHFNEHENKIWVADLTLSKDSAIPIKTYIDYGLDRDPKEEFKIDPMTPLLEMLSQVGKNQQVWIQFIIRGHKKTKVSLFKETDTWKDAVEAQIKDIIKKATLKPEDDKKPSQMQLSSVQKDMIEKLERSLQKFTFDVGGRVLYVAHKDYYDKSIQSGIIGAMKQFGSANLNTFVGTGYLTAFNYPWQDFREMRQNRARMFGLAAYKRRNFFYGLGTGKAFVMNVEALATVYHFPGSTSRAPGIQRIPSKKSIAPNNLPI